MSWRPTSRWSVEAGANGTFVRRLGNPTGSIVLRNQRSGGASASMNRQMSTRWTLGLGVGADNRDFGEGVQFYGTTVGGRLQLALSRRLGLEMTAGGRASWRVTDGESGAARLLGAGDAALAYVIALSPSKRLEVGARLTLQPYHDPIVARLDHRIGLSGELSLVLSSRLQLSATGSWSALARSVLEDRRGRPGQDEQNGFGRVSTRIRLSTGLVIDLGLQGAVRLGSGSTTDDDRNEILAYSSIIAAAELLD